MSSMFESIFASSTGEGVAGFAEFLAAMGMALVVGLILAAVYAFRSSYTRSFIVTLMILPAIVSVVIMMVNGNIGAGIAVAGAFSLVRFRSIPGSAKDIATIFLAMGTGLICGMGYLAYALMFTVIMGLVMVIIQLAGPVFEKNSGCSRIMKITVPEDLEFTDMFDEILDRYTSKHELIGMKTTAMGSLFKLTYDLELKDPSLERELIDELRVRNGNLEINLNRNSEVNANAL